MQQLIAVTHILQSVDFEHVSVSCKHLGDSFAQSLWTVHMSQSRASTSETHLHSLCGCISLKTTSETHLHSLCGFYTFAQSLWILLLHTYIHTSNFSFPYIQLFFPIHYITLHYITLHYITLYMYLYLHYITLYMYLYLLTTTYYIPFHSIPFHSITLHYTVHVLRLTTTYYIPFHSIPLLHTLLPDGNPKFQRNTFLSLHHDHILAKLGARKSLRLSAILSIKDRREAARRPEHRRARNSARQLAPCQRGTGRSLGKIWEDRREILSLGTQFVLQTEVLRSVPPDLTETPTGSSPARCKSRARQHSRCFVASLRRTNFVPNESISCQSPQISLRPPQFPHWHGASHHVQLCASQHSRCFVASLRRTSFVPNKSISCWSPQISLRPPQFPHWHGASHRVQLRARQHSRCFVASLRRTDLAKTPTSYSTFTLRRIFVFLE